VRRDHEGVDQFAGGRGDPEFLGRADVNFAGELLIEGGQPPDFVPLGQIGAPELDRLADAGAGAEHAPAIRGDPETGDVAKIEELTDRPLLQVDLIKRNMAAHIGGEIEAAAVGSPLKSVDPIIERLGEEAMNPVLAVINGQTFAVRFINRHLLRNVGDIAAVGRPDRLAIIGGIILREVEAVPFDEGFDPDILVGGLVIVAVRMEGDGELPAVRGEGKTGMAAGAGIGGLVDRARSEVGELAVGQGVFKGVDDAAVPPPGPVAVEEAVGEVGLHRPLLHGLENLLAAVIVAAALGIDHGGENKAAAVRQPLRISRGDGQISEAARLAPVGREQPDLPPLVAAGEEGDGFTVRRPARMVIALRAEGELPQSAAVEVHQPEVAVALGFGEILRADDKDHLPAVRRDLDVADRFEGIEIGDLEGASLRCEQGDGER